MRWTMFGMPVILTFAIGAAPATQPAKKKTGPSAASLATPYSGPLRFDPRLLAAERKASFDSDPVRRAATWRYYYSAPTFYWGGYGFGSFSSCGFRFPISYVAYRGEY